MIDFSEWVSVTSQMTNRSLAGSRVLVDCSAENNTYSNAENSNESSNENNTKNNGENIEKFLKSAQSWGIIPTNCKKDADFDATKSLENLKNTTINAPSLSGKDAIDYAQKHMPVMQALLSKLREKGLDLQGIRIAVCLVLEPKTAVLLRELHAYGATVGVFCAPDETDQRVADQLKKEGIVVQADRSWTPAQTHEGALKLLDEIQPNIIIDDGASFARLASLERPQIAAKLIGVAEETTSGVRAFEAMQEAGQLKYPVIAVNNSALKTDFDNRHGTGETCVTTMQKILGSACFRNAKVTVVGYGPVGRGFALRIRALGANVTICDTNPVQSLRAVFDGFEAKNLECAVTSSTMIVSATGVRHTISLQHMQKMQENTILAVIGGIANEIALDEIRDFKPIIGTAQRQIQVPNGPQITLISEGDGTNYTTGGGNPIEIMDFSFAVQVSAVAYLLEHNGENANQSDNGKNRLNAGIYQLPEASDNQIASIALEKRGYSASEANKNNGYRWDLTRFAEEESN